MSHNTNRRLGRAETVERGWDAAPEASATVPGAAFGLSSLQCPDCGARPVGIQLTHADTCPLDRAINLVLDGDRDWFAAHPGEDTRRRPVTRAEVLDAVAAGMERPVGTVTVFQLAPGLRSRMFEYADGAR